MSQMRVHTHRQWWAGRCQRWCVHTRHPCSSPPTPLATACTSAPASHLLSLGCPLLLSLDAGLHSKDTTCRDNLLPEMSSSASLSSCMYLAYVTARTILPESWLWEKSIVVWYSELNLFRSRWNVRWSPVLQVAHENKSPMINQRIASQPINPALWEHGTTISICGCDSNKSVIIDNHHHLE